MQHSIIPFGTEQLAVTFEEQEVYLVRRFCTSGQWKVSDCGLCGQVRVLWELAPELGAGLGEHSSWMTV